jgi:hypothetical protein
MVADMNHLHVQENSLSEFLLYSYRGYDKLNLQSPFKMCLVGCMSAQLDPLDAGFSGLVDCTEFWAWLHGCKIRRVAWLHESDFFQRFLRAWLPRCSTRPFSVTPHMQALTCRKALALLLPSRHRFPVLISPLNHHRHAAFFLLLPLLTSLGTQVRSSFHPFLAVFLFFFSNWPACLEIGRDLIWALLKELRNLSLSAAWA